jgi:hypothetical protein
LREEYKRRVFENRVLRRIFGPKRDKVTGEWRRPHNKELYVLYSLPNTMQVIKPKKTATGGARSTYRGKERCTEGFSGKT